MANIDFLENEFIEFKKTTGELKESIISIVSILNKHKYGKIYFGIKDNGEIIGQDVSNKTIREVSKAISENIEPKLYPIVNKIKIDDKECIVVEFEGDDTPYLAFGRAYMRVGDEDRQLFIEGKESSMPRNPLIANTLYLSKDIEKWGSGLKRITEECKNANIKVKFETKKDGFTVIFYRKNDEELYSLTQENSKNVALNDKNVALNIELKIKQRYPKLRKVYIDIIKIIIQNKYITQEEIADELNKTRNSIYRDTKTLRDMEILERLGSKKKGYWKINI